MKSRKEPREAKNKLMFRAISIVCIVIAAGALVYIGYFLRQYWITESDGRKAREAYERAIEAMAMTTAQPEATPWPDGPPPLPTPLPSGLPADDLDHAELARQAERERLLAAEVTGRARFAELLAINPDYLGMFQLEGLGISEPYVQGEDNDTYLNTSFGGKRSENGSLFLSVHNDRLLTDRNSVIFGHYTETGLMFAPLLKYRDSKTWTKAPVIVLDSLHGKTEWVIFAAYVTEPDYGYIETGLYDENFAGLLEEFHMRSLFHTNIEVTETDRVLTLSTCAYEFRDARFAVHARKLRDGEDLEELLAELTVEKNPSPKPYDAPQQINFADIPANRSTAMFHKPTGKTYYFQGAEDGGMAWYIVSGRNVQGPYSGYTGPMTSSSTLSAVYSDAARRNWIAFDGYKGTPGVFLLTSRIAAGPFSLSRKTPVTPVGVDARWPLLALDDAESLWLVYTVKETVKASPDPDVIVEHVYLMSLKDGAPGTPELILTREGDVGVRPSGLFWIDGTPLLVWQEAAPQKLFSLWLVEEEAQPIPFTTVWDHDRVSFHGPVANGVAKLLTEKGGKLNSSGSLDLKLVPPPPEPEPEPELEEEEPLPPDAEEPGTEPAATPEPAEDWGEGSDVGI